MHQYDKEEVLKEKYHRPSIVFAKGNDDDIDEILEQPAKTVATRYRRALMKLEERLNAKMDKFKADITESIDFQIKTLLKILQRFKITSVRK